MANPSADAPCTDAHAVDLGFAELTALQVVVLGIVQGITELLPISSTAHLRVIPGLLGWQDPGSAFSAAMQLASFAAVISYFWSDIRKLAGNSLTALARRDYQSQDFRLLLGIIIGTLPLLVAGALLRPILNGCQSPLRGLIVIGIASVAMSVLLAIAERAARHTRSFSQLTSVRGSSFGTGSSLAWRWWSGSWVAGYATRR
jgi:undecaprenyl-diphosphatase